MRFYIERFILCGVILIFQSLSTPAQQMEVDLELVLLADATGSIDDDEIKFQRQGYASAIQHPDILAAISKGTLQKIAVTFVEWGDDTSQEIVVPWTIINGSATARAFAAAVLEPPRKAFGPNAIGSALLKAKDLIEKNRFLGLRKVIDLSADSANNWHGPPIAVARAGVLKAGITINGLAILCRTCVSGRPVSYNLEQAFKDRIVGGPRAFVITADNKQKFAQAVRQKLILEIAAPAAQPRVYASGTAFAKN